MNLKTIVAPPVTPVTIEQVRDHLRLIPDDDSPPTHPQDAMLERLMKVATGEAESITKRAFIEQTARLYTPAFPCHNFVPYLASYPWGDTWVWHRHGIELLRPPFIGISSVRYYDADNELQTVDADSYFVTDDLVPMLRFVDDFTAPTHYARSDAVWIDYVVGYPPEGSPAEDYRENVPEEIKQAVLLGVELQYRSMDTKNREVLEKARDALLSSFIVYTVV